MRNILLSMGWLYYDFAVILLGTELVATLRKKDVLLLRALFRGIPRNREAYLRKLITHFGRYCTKGEYLFHEGEHGHELYYIVSGNVAICHQGTELRRFDQDEYFGEMAFLTDTPRIADAVVISEFAEILVISKENLETLLLEEPNVAMSFLKEMALRLKQTNHKVITASNSSS
jgi:membrane protein